MNKLLATIVAVFAITAAPLAQAAPEMQKVADDLYFRYDKAGTNSIIWVTDEGVLVVDTQRHPDWAEALIADIREITDAPIKWAVNSQAHGDHFMGNDVFKKAGATIVAHKDAATLMDVYWDKDLKRRLRGFERVGLDPSVIVKVLPDVTFEDEMVIRMGGREARLMYMGPGQDPGAAYVYFPHAKVLATSGNFATKGIPNPMFTPSLDAWIAQLDTIQTMDVNIYLPGHSTAGTKQDVADAAQFLRDFKSKVNEARAAGLDMEAAAEKITMPHYADWRSARNLPARVRSLYQHLETGLSPYWDTTVLGK